MPRIIKETTLAEDLDKKHALETELTGLEAEVKAAASRRTSISKSVKRMSGLFNKDPIAVKKHRIQEIKDTLALLVPTIQKKTAQAKEDREKLQVRVKEVALMVEKAINALLTDPLQGPFVAKDYQDLQAALAQVAEDPLAAQILSKEELGRLQVYFSDLSQRLAKANNAAAVIVQDPLIQQLMSKEFNEAIQQPLIDALELRSHVINGQTEPQKQFSMNRMLNRVMGESRTLQHYDDWERISQSLNFTGDEEFIGFQQNINSRLTFGAQIKAETILREEFTINDYYSFSPLAIPKITQQFACDYAKFQCGLIGSKDLRHSLGRFNADLNRIEQLADKLYVNGVPPALNSAIQTHNRLAADFIKVGRQAGLPTATQEEPFPNPPNSTIQRSRSRSL